MTTDRISKLKTMQSNRPDDPFLPYAIGIEYKNMSKFPEAIEHFKDVHDRFPDYIPNFFHYAGSLEALEDFPAAIAIYDEGIEKASAQDDQHALSELKGARELILDFAD